MSPNQSILQPHGALLRAPTFSSITPVRACTQAQTSAHHWTCGYTLTACPWTRSSDIIVVSPQPSNPETLEPYAQVLSTDGDPALGGDDFTRAVADRMTHLQQQQQHQQPRRPEREPSSAASDTNSVGGGGDGGDGSEGGRQRLEAFRAAEQAKIGISERPSHRSSGSSGAGGSGGSSSGEGHGMRTHEAAAALDRSEFDAAVRCAP